MVKNYNKKRGDDIMLKKTIEYTDYNGTVRKEDFYFNLTKAEVTEMELSKNGGLSEHINRIVASKDSPEIINLFKEIIAKSYGVKSLDGKRFIKSEEILNEFIQTEAYSELFMELAFDAEKAAAFVNGITPKGLENK